MGDVMIRVSAEVRDRLAALAADRGVTIGEAVAQLAAGNHTTAEVAANRERLAHALGLAEAPGPNLSIRERLAAARAATPEPGVATL